MRRNFLTMEERESNCCNRRDSVTNSSSEEWTIIDRTENLDHNKVAEDGNVSLEEHNHIQILDKNVILPSEEVGEDVITVDNNVEESDDISVITDSDSDQVIVERRVKTQEKIKENSDVMLEMNSKPFIEFSALFLQDWSVLNSILACFLAVVIGFYAGRTFNMENQSSVSPSTMNSQMFGTDNALLTDYVKQLSHVNQTLSQVLRLILSQFDPEVRKTRAKEAAKEDQQKFNERFANASSTMPEEFAILQTLCSQNQAIMGNICQVPNIVIDLNQLKMIINSSIDELGHFDKPQKIKFFKHMENTLNYITQSFLDDLLNSVNRLVLKMHKKVKKAKSKFNKWVCLSHKKSIFGENSTLWKHCNEVFNVTKVNDTKLKKTFRKKIVYSVNSTFNFWKKTSEKSNKLYKVTNNHEKFTCTSENDNDSNTVRQKKCHAHPKLVEQNEYEQQQNSDEHMDNYVKKNNLKSPWTSGTKSVFKEDKESKLPDKDEKVEYEKYQKNLNTHTTASVQAPNTEFTKYSEMQNNVKETKYRKYNGKNKKCSIRKCDKGEEKLRNSEHHSDNTNDAEKTKGENSRVPRPSETNMKNLKTVVFIDQKHRKKTNQDHLNDLSEADWQWKRNHAREEMRRFHDQPSNWYFNRTRLRRHFRNK